MKTCSTCKFWNFDSNREDSSEAALGLGACQAARMFWDCTKWDDDGNARMFTDDAAGETAFVQDGSDYFARLYTKPEHGCTMHQPKPNA